MERQIDELEARHRAAFAQTEAWQSQLDVTNADHAVLWLEANDPYEGDAWLAVQIVEAHERATATLRAALQQVVDALVKHHQWHAAQTDPDPEHGFIPANEYGDSSLCDQTFAALHAAAEATGPHNFAACAPTQVSA